MTLTRAASAFSYDGLYGAFIAASFSLLYNKAILEKECAAASAGKVGNPWIM